MMRVYYEHADGTVTITPDLPDGFFGNAGGPQETVDLHRAKWLQSHVGQAIVNTHIVPDDDPEPFRAFRGAWQLNGTALVVDMPRARIIHMDRIRVARDAELVRLDGEVNRNEDQGPRDNTNRGKRQTLRDLPANFDLSGATTPEQLDALWPAELPPRP